MAGHVSGVQKCIRQKYPRATFVHCAAHCLNLVINDQSKGGLCMVLSNCSTPSPHSILSMTFDINN